MRNKRKSNGLLAWQAGKTPGPWWVVLFPTFRCNLRCAICSRTWYNDPLEFKKEMSDERMLRLIDECAELGVREICIGGGGEPTVRGDLVMKLCERTKHHGMYGILQTNGTLLTPEQVERLVRIKWDVMNISIDGPAAEICDAIRQKGVFDKAVGTIREFRAAKKRHWSNLPQLKIVSVITSLNYDKMEKTVEILHEAGADEVLFKDMVVYADGMKEFALSEAQAAELPERLERALVRASQLGLGLLGGSFAQCEKAAAAEPKDSAEPAVRHGYERALCLEPWLSMVVLCNGYAAPCCSLWRGIAGDLHEKTLREIWLGPEFMALRNDIIEGRGPEPCKVCQPEYVLRKQQLLARLRHIDHYRATPWNLAARVVSSLRRYGIRRSIQRGRQWLEIRKRM